jgi:1,4-alpha-glucan branching enzyme
VILDWVPSHFPTDAHGLYQFDGTHLYEHADPRQGYHPDWNSAIFNYSRNEVRSFLVSSAMCWLDRYHVDGLRVDAVASMLYLDYSRNAGEWIPNEFGGRENLDAIVLLRELNEAIYGEFPDVATMAEESTAWPMVSRPTYIGGLGFGYKWDMGWMHDTLAYLARDPIHRRWHHDEVTFRSVYAGSEHYVLPLSHDEVVHGKGSLLGKMPGDEWQQFANLRLLYAMQWAQPGKKLLFMGGELATRREWAHDDTLDWSLHDIGLHSGVRAVLADLNRVYADEPALHRGDSDPGAMRWVEGSDADRGVFAWLRLDPRHQHLVDDAGDGNRDGDAGATDPTARPVLCVMNATPMPQHNYRLGVPQGSRWVELVNTDAEVYGGSGVGNFGGVDTVPVDSHGFHQSIVVSIPPLGALFLAPEQ